MSTNNFFILGGPKDGQNIALEPGKTSYEVVLLIQTGMEIVADRVQTSTFRYTARDLFRESPNFRILAPEFWTDKEAIVALTHGYKASRNL